MKKLLCKTLSVFLIASILCLLIFGNPQKVKADPIALGTLGLAGAVVAILGAFGVTMTLNSGSATTNEEFIYALDKMLPFNQNFQEWREGMQITDTGKIFVRNDVLHDILSSFYDNNRNNFFTHVLENSVFGGASYRWDVDINSGSLNNLPSDQIFQVGDVISTVNTIPDFADTVESFLLNSGWFTSEPPEAFYSALDEIRRLDDGTNIIDFEFSQTVFKVIYYPKSAITGLSIRSVTPTTNASGTFYSYALSSFINYHQIHFYRTGGNSGTNTSNGRAPLYSGGIISSNYPVNGTYIGSLSDGTVVGQVIGSVSVEDLNDLSSDAGIWEKINRACGTNLAPDLTQPDTVVLNPDSDTPIDYPYDQTGTIINSGVIPVPIENNIDAWGEDIIDRTLGRDLAGSADINVVNELGTIGTITGEVLTDTAIEFDDPLEIINENEISDVISITNDINYLQGLTLLFPFCIPFDLAEIYKLLLADPEPIKFDWELDFTMVGLSKYEIDIDLSDFDDVASIFRIMIFIGFLIFLTLKTRDLIRG